MISASAFKDIVQQPLGPYLEEHILREQTCQMRNTNRLVLYSFILEHNGHVTGLDESEKPLKGRADNRRFRFRGVLTIANPEWLSDSGLKDVETELNLRAREHALREGRRCPAPFTLDELFDRELLTASCDATQQEEDETRLMVRIQGERNMPATYMQAKMVPNGLLWNSKAHNRDYEIATMDVDTYSCSENFFWRWRLLALMEKIVKQYPYVPALKRTPIWFVERYLEKFACPPGDKHQRLLGSEDDSDIDDKGKTKTPRHLLRPHTSEILGLFAAHAEWFITQTVSRSKGKELIDVISWDNFAKEVRKERKEAARLGVKWGWPIGEEPEEERLEDESSETGLDEMVERNPVIGKNNRLVARKIALAKAKPNHRTDQNFSSDPGSEEDAPGVAEYVSDFSEPSDAEEDDWDGGSAEEDAAYRIPWQLQLPPLLPDVDGRWWCPMQGCDRQINLHNLSEEEKRWLSEEAIGCILQKQWRNGAYDRRVLSGFKDMVTKHYLQHLRDCGIKPEKREGGPKFVYIDNRRRRRGTNERRRGPVPVRGTLGGERRVVPTVHPGEVGHIQ